MLEYIHIVFEAGSFLVSLLYYSYLKNSFLRWLPLFLFWICAGEILNRILHSTIFEYLIAIAESFFYGYVFFHLTTQKRLRTAIICFVAAINITYIIAYFFFDTSNTQITYFVMIFIVFGYCISAIALSCLYSFFIDSESMLIVYEPGFWIVFGVCIFYSGISIAFSLYPVIIRENLSVMGIRLYHMAPRLFSIVLYSSLSASVLLTRRKSIRAAC